MKKLLTTLALCTLFLTTTPILAHAQDATDVPTPTAETTEVAPVPDVTVVVEAPAPVDTAPDTTVQSFLFAGVVLAGLAGLAYIFKQHGINLEVVSKTVPIEFAQFAFRQGMTQALATPLQWDDDALKELAKQTGYQVIDDGRGGYTIIASPSKVAANVVAQNAPTTTTEVNKGKGY